MWNEHKGSEADQASEDSALLQEHRDEDKAEGFVGPESVRRDRVQPARSGRRRDDRINSTLHIPAETDGAVRQ